MQLVRVGAGRVDPAVLVRIFEPGPVRILAVMVSSLDGRATIRGRSGPLGSEADRSVLAFLRASAQAILVGAATAVREGYGPAHVRDPRLAALRAELGLGTGPVPIAVATRHEPPLVASRRVSLERISSRSTLLEATGVDPTGRGHLLVEGGPRLFARLLDGGLLDELSLTLAPVVVGTGELGLAPEPLTYPRAFAPRALLVTDRELVWRLERSQEA